MTNEIQNMQSKSRCEQNNSRDMHTCQLSEKGPAHTRHPTFCTLHVAHIEQHPAEILQGEVGTSRSSELSERYPKFKRGDT
jgi:hypothetical protein